MIRTNNNGKNNPTTMSHISGTVVGRAQLASKLGKQYGTQRDLYQALGYPKTLVFADYVAKYTRLAIAAAVINRPVSATWNGGVKILEADNDEETQLEREWQALSKRLALTSMFGRLDRLAGLGVHAVLFLGFNDTQNTQGLTLPIIGGKKELMYVKPIAENSIEITAHENDSNNPRFGLPLMYRLTIMTDSNNSSTSIDVHHSRVIHVPSGELLESETDGVPRLEAIFNNLMDIEKLVGGSGEMFWRGARPGFRGKVDSDFQLTTEQEALLQTQFDEYEHNLRRFLIAQGLDVQTLAMQIADPAAHVDVQLQMISAVTGIPKRILTGSEIGDLASSQDRTNWFNIIKARRDNYAEQVIVRPFIDRLIEVGTLSQPKDEYIVEWEDLFAQSEKERVDIGLIRAQAVAAYSNALGADSIMPPEAFLRTGLGLSDEEIELVKEEISTMVIEDERNPEEEKENDEDI